MKIIGSIKANILDLKKTFRNYPLSMGISILIGIIAIYMDNLDYGSQNYNHLYDLVRILSLGFIWTIGLRSYFKRRDRKAEYISYGILALVLMAYYIYDLKGLGIYMNTRYMGLFILSIFLVPLMGRLKTKQDYEFYILDYIEALMISFIYSLVLFLGMTSILATIGILFDITISSKLYFYLFIFVASLFAPMVFLSRIPEGEEDYLDRGLNKTLKFLISHIIIPLIFIYTVIIYAYFFKVLITWSWPKGVVANLILWYSLFSLFIVFLVQSFDGGSGEVFRKYFPVLNIFLIIMLFIASYFRIEQYGITENRYFILAGGLFIVIMDAYYGFLRRKDNRFFPMVLSIIIFLSIIGPFSAFSLSKFSQIKRLESILKEEYILREGKLYPKTIEDPKLRMEVNNIFYYISHNHGLESLKFLGDGFTLDKDFEESFGFEYRDYNIVEENQYTYLDYYRKGNLDKPLDISDYDYYLEGDYYEERNFKVSNNSIRASRGVIDFKLDKETYKIDLNHELIGELARYDFEDIRDMDLEYKYEFLDSNIRVIIKDFSAKKEDKDYSINSINYIILIK